MEFQSLQSFDYLLMLCLVSEYFAVFYAICIITSKDSQYYPKIKGFNLIAFNYDDSSNSSRKLFRDGIEQGCQAFVISDDTFLNFLNDFHDVHDDCIKVYPNKHVVVYQTEAERKLSKFEESYQHFPAVDGSEWHLKL